MIVLAGAVTMWCASPLAVMAAPARGAAAEAGTWGTAIEVPGSGALNEGGGCRRHLVVLSLGGGCAARGSYVDGSDHGQAFVVSQT